MMNKCMQKAGEPKNDAGFLKVIIIAAVQIVSSIHTPLSLQFLSIIYGSTKWLLLEAHICTPLAMFIYYMHIYIAHMR